MQVRRNKHVEIVPLSTGCLGACTYCKTKHARGALGSYELAAIAKRVSKAAADPQVSCWLTQAAALQVRLHLLQDEACARRAGQLRTGCRCHSRLQSSRRTPGQALVQHALLQGIPQALFPRAWGVRPLKACRAGLLTRSTDRRLCQQPHAPRLQGVHTPLPWGTAPEERPAQAP